MDIFAHALWATAGAREANLAAEKKNNKSRISLGWIAFFGIFPDLFAFTIPFMYRFYNVLVSGNNISSFFERPPVIESGVEGSFSLALNLYQYSHSLVIWALVFMIVWFVYKRPRYELLGWALHILIDIPSHVIAFFPTPFLFPFSDYRFPYGIEWSNMYFMIINYSLLLIVWGRMLIRDIRVKYQNNKLIK